MQRVVVCLLTAVLAGPVAATESLPPEPTGASAPTESAAPIQSEAQGSVTRAIVTTGVLEREPVDSVDRIPAAQDRVYFFTELANMQGQTVVHRWEYGGEVLAEVPFDVNGPRWRVHSSKRLLAGWTGTWTLTVVDGEGQEQARKTFEYVADEPEPESEVEAPAAEVAPASPEAP